jgi:8-oxo-dGTP diphosphatase
MPAPPFPPLPPPTAAPFAPVRRAFSVAIFCRHQGEVLLIHHRRLNAWLPIGGEIEPGETPLQAARRELFEETGLEGNFPLGLGVDGTPDGFIGYEEHLAGSKGLHMNFAFVADVPSRNLATCNEYDAVLWVGTTVEVETPRNVRQLVALALAAPSTALAGA